MMLQSLASIGTGVVIGFVFSWKMTLAILAFAPFMLMAGFIQMRVMTGNTNQDKNALEDSGKVSIISEYSTLNQACIISWQFTLNYWP